MRAFAQWPVGGCWAVEVKGELRENLRFDGLDSGKRGLDRHAGGSIFETFLWSSLGFMESGLRV